MNKIIELVKSLFKKAPKWLRVTLTTLFCIIISTLGYLYVSCGSLSLEKLDWKHQSVVEETV